MNHIFLDLETSGLELPDATILSFGVIAEVNDNLVQFTSNVRPSDDAWRKVSPSALAVNGLGWNDLKDYPELDVVSRMFVCWIMDNNITLHTHKYVGQNPLFDIKFLLHYIGEGTLDFIGFPYRDPIDVRDLYTTARSKKLAPSVPKRSSEHISKALGLEPEPFPHNALAGADAVMRSFSKLQELLGY